MSKSSDDKKNSSNRLNLSRLVGIIARFSQNSRRILILSVITLIVESLTALWIPVVVGYSITYVTFRVNQILGTPGAVARSPLQLLGLNSGINPDVETLVLVALGIVVLTMINSLCDSLTEIYLAQGGRGVGYNMRVFLYGHLQKLSLTFHNQSRTGDILTRVTSDVAAVEDFIISNLSDFLGSALFLIFVLIGMFWKAWNIWIRTATRTRLRSTQL